MFTDRWASRKNEVKNMAAIEKGRLLILVWCLEKQ